MKVAITSWIIVVKVIQYFTTTYGVEMTMERRVSDFGISSKLQMVKLSGLIDAKRVSVFEHIKWTGRHER